MKKKWQECTTYLKHTVNKIKTLAFDFGASSIRMFLSELDANILQIKEVFRVKNRPAEKNGKLYWDSQLLENALLEGLKSAKNLQNVKSLAIDTWGTDYVWLDENDNLLFEPVSYRENISKNLIDEVHQIVSFDEIYKISGIGFNSINSIYRIYNDIHNEKVLEKGGKKILFMPDYLTFVLTKKYNYDFSICSTSGLIDAKTKSWSKELFKKLNIPISIVGSINYEPREIGEIANEKFKSVLKEKIIVISINGHDSACGVFGTGIFENQCYIINGTWSLVGNIQQNAIIDNNSLNLGISNEGYVDKKIRFNKLLIGLWIQQKLYEEWYPKSKPDYDEIKRLVSESNYDSIIDTEYEIFATNCDMSLEIGKYMKSQNINLDLKKYGDVIRAVQGGLIDKFKLVLNNWSNFYNLNYEYITLLGGGNYDELFCQRIANELKKEVRLAHAESSVIGNSLMQFKILKKIELNDIKKILKNSFKEIVYVPGGKKWID